ncbi:MAG: ROK family protein, partial [Bacteroidales bacterium]|nr:ROK family protein [Bacteroidales bacterium]
MTQTFSIGIDIGGTNTDMGLVREDGTIIARSNIPTNIYTELQPYVRDIMGSIEGLMRDNGVENIEGIGIG